MIAISIIVMREVVYLALSIEYLALLRLTSMMSRVLQNVIIIKGTNASNMAHAAL